MKILYTLLMACAIVLSASTLTLAVHEGPSCWPYSEVIKTLRDGPFKEALIFEGTDSRRGEGLRLFVGPKGTYSLVIVNDENGMACAVSLGDGVVIHPAPLLGEPV